MSSLRLLNETSGSSVSSVQIPNVFSEDFDIYKVTMEHDGSTNSNGNLRYMGVNNARYQLDKYTFANWTEGGSVTWIINPYSTSSYTYNITQSIGYGGTTTPATPMRCIGVVNEQSRFTGFECAIGTGTYGTITIRTYGLRVD